MVLLLVFKPNYLGSALPLNIVNSD